MNAIPVKKAQKQLVQLIRMTRDAHVPITIVGDTSNAIMLSEDDWKNIQETMAISAVPGLKSSIKRGLKIPLKKCSKKLPW